MRPVVLLLVMLVLRPLGAAAGEIDRVIARESFEPELLARAVFEETNRVRREHGLFEFGALAEADAAADIQASLGYVPGLAPHTNPFWGVSTLAERVQRVGLNAIRAGENAAKLPIIDTEGEDHFGLRDVDGVKLPVHLGTGKVFGRHTYRTCAVDLVRRWLNSRGHRENLLSRNHRILGCAARMIRHDGLDQVFAVQVFIATGPPKRRG